jgi:putative transposase
MRPSREQVQYRCSAYFVSTQTAQRQPFFRHERRATLLREMILHYDETGYFLCGCVIMPDHLHLLIVPKDTIEKAVQLVKGGFSFRAKREFAWKFEIWQQGFSDHRIRDEEDWQNHLEYIRQNPVQAGLVADSRLCPYIDFPKQAFPQGLKPNTPLQDSNVRTEARTLQDQAHTVRFPRG